MCFLIMMTWNLLILLFYYQYDRNIFYYYIHCLIFATYIVYYFSLWNFCYILDLGSGSVVFFFFPYFFHFFIFWLSPLRHSLNLIFQTINSYIISILLSLSHFVNINWEIKFISLESLLSEFRRLSFGYFQVLSVLSYSYPCVSSNSCASFFFLIASPDLIDFWTCPCFLNDSSLDVGDW